MEITNSYKDLPTKWQGRGSEAMEEAIHCLKGRLIGHKELFSDNELGSIDELCSTRIRVDCIGEVEVALV
jgi:hypothetical protein